MLQELARNLIHNAIKHATGRDAGRAFGPTPATAALTVSDSGPGVADELAARLFQPFSAGDLRHGSAWAWPSATKSPRRWAAASAWTTGSTAGVPWVWTPRCATAGAGSRAQSDLMDKLRIDKWLWAARFYKTRSLAVDELQRGRVQVNGQDAKPSREVKAGDTIELQQGPVRRTVVVRASRHCADRRRWRNNSEETAASIAERERAAEQRRLAPEPAPVDRPRAPDQTRPTRTGRQGLGRPLERVDRRLNRKPPSRSKAHTHAIRYQPHRSRRAGG